VTIITLNQTLDFSISQQKIITIKNKELNFLENANIVNSDNIKNILIEKSFVDNNKSISLYFFINKESKIKEF
jgi:hypothetical protein